MLTDGALVPGMQHYAHPAKDPEPVEEGGPATAAGAELDITFTATTAANGDLLLGRCVVSQRLRCYVLQGHPFDTFLAPLAISGKVIACTFCAVGRARACMVREWTWSGSAHEAARITWQLGTSPFCMHTPAQQQRHGAQLPGRGRV